MRNKPVNTSDWLFATVMIWGVVLVAVLVLIIHFVAPFIGW
jgi:hypothetical protein